MRMRFNRFTHLFLILLCAYILVNFLLLPHNHLINFPLYMDDYKSLSLTFDSISWKHPRPVIYFLGPFFAKLGISGFYCLVLAGIILCAAVILIFIEAFFLSQLSTIWIFLYGILLFSFPFILFVSKFLGVIINLCSIFFGTCSLIFLLKAHRTNKLFYYFVSGILFLLTIYTKEDYILPNFLLIFYCLFLDSRSNKNETIAITRMRIFLLYSILSVFSLIFFNHMIAQSPFTQGGNNLNPYAIDLHPLSILKITMKYLTCHIYLTLILVFAIILSLRKKTLLIWGIIFSLILPYAILPNHVTLFYIFNWLPWEIALICVCLKEQLSALNLKFQYCIIVLLSVIFILISFPHRIHNAIMYENEAKINKNIINTLMTYQSILNQQIKPIAIMGKGIEGFSPWRVSQAEYIQNNVQIHAKWIVFLSSHSAEIQKNYNPDLNVNTLYIGKYPAFKKNPVLFFDAEGRGKFFTSSLQ